MYKMKNDNKRMNSHFDTINSVKKYYDTFVPD